MHSFIEILMKPKSLLCGLGISQGNNERNLKPLLYPIVIMNPFLLEKEEIIENYDHILSYLFLCSVPKKSYSQKVIKALIKIIQMLTKAKRVCFIKGGPFSVASLNLGILYFSFGPN